MELWAIRKMDKLEADNARLRAAVAAQDSRIADLEEDNLRLALLATNANLGRTRLRPALGEEVLTPAGVGQPEPDRDLEESKGNAWLDDPGLY